ncbi:porin [Rhodoferax ferrireducens]|uniref:porin n=1 Tax=Rhodoferax ferrireducens TaxID=192843 RepID=UPI000E0D6052|nr:porin [Rhodoferax ferrireducens]
MKKSLIALAVLAASGASFAQSSVSIYGIADVWFGRTTLSNAPSQIKLDSGGVSGSRFGFKGSEDLGGGLKANFLLEQGFNIDTGAASTAGQTFSRQSYVGFSGGFGEVKLGKMWTAYDDINGATNAVFDSALSPQNNVWLSTGYQANPNNGLYYVSPSMGGFSAAVSYALGENKTATVDAGSVVSFNVKYEGGPVYAGLAHQREKATDAAEATNFTRVNGSYDLGVAKLLAGYGRVTGAADTSTSEWQLGADFPVSGALTLSAGVARSSDNAAKGDATRKGYGLGAAYAMSKRTTVYGGYQSANVAKPGVADTDATLLAVGLKHTF